MNEIRVKITKGPYSGFLGTLLEEAEASGVEASEGECLVRLDTDTVVSLSMSVLDGGVAPRSGLRVEIVTGPMIGMKGTLLRRSEHGCFRIALDDGYVVGCRGDYLKVIRGSE